MSFEGTGITPSFSWAFRIQMAELLLRLHGRKLKPIKENFMKTLFSLWGGAVTGTVDNGVYQVNLNKTVWSAAERRRVRSTSVTRPQSALRPNRISICSWQRSKLIRRPPGGSG